MANFYDIPLQESELLNRPNQTFTVKGQAGLLATALALDVPVLSSDTNTLVGFTSFQAGTGASFAVSRAEHELVPLIRDKLVNTSSEVQDRWKRTLFQGSRNERFVVKRIVPSKDSANPSDAPRLAPLVNEIRILSNQRLKQCPFIVPLIALSWYESQVNGRFWPQLLLEAADEGTLTEYLASSEISFNTQLALSQEIAQGLKYLHDQGIVHCDLKPGNMLVYSKNVSSERLEMCINAGIEPVEVKICDFGFAVILSDYEAGRRFQARIGTVPWMAPELDMAEPVALDLLHKADIYSFGLVVASILMRGVRPFQGLLAGEITELKGQTIGSSDSVVTTLLGNIQEKITLNEHQEEFIEAFLSGVCEPEPEDRVCLAAVQRYLFMGMLQCLADGEPLIPTAFFPDLDDAYPGYL
ncbi:kinase-like domain-containing protein [Aspergillus multicolor]|uniref:kinase-like domain-containing protein n=1 Tax=Aspergillus multicolor TaxID=41759 RepID=UPI003CCD8FC1